MRAILCNEVGRVTLANGEGSWAGRVAPSWDDIENGDGSFDGTCRNTRWLRGFVASSRCALEAVENASSASGLAIEGGRT